MKKEKIRFAKVMLCPFDSDSRSKRECAVVHEVGFDVSIYDTSLIKGVFMHSDYHHYPTPDKFQGGILGRAVKFVKWGYKIRKGNYDLISAYDISALLISWLSNFGKSKKTKAKLIYDSHEFEFGRNTTRASWVSWIVVRIERFLMKRCEQSIMVNETIAKEVQKLHKLETTPIVVRNMAPYTIVDTKKCLTRRTEIYDISSKPKDHKILMYHGAVVPGRGIEIILDSLPYLTNILFVILGNGKHDYINKLKQKAETLFVSENVIFHPAVPVDILWEYVGAADIGIVNIENISLSYYYSLPNKLFENIQAETPVVGSNFPELTKIIEGYDIGLTCDTSSSEELVKTIDLLLNDTELYSKFKRNIKKSKEILCWENEKVILFSFYKKLYEDLSQAKN